MFYFITFVTLFFALGFGYMMTLWIHKRLEKEEGNIANNDD